MSNSDVGAFRSGPQLALDRFLNRARSLRIFAEDHPHAIAFDAPSWDLHGHITLPHVRAETKVRIPGKGDLHDAFKCIIATVIWDSRKKKKGLSQAAKFALAGRLLTMVLDEEGLPHDPSLLRVDHLEAARAKSPDNRDLPGTLNIIAKHLSSEGITPDLEGYRASFSKAGGSKSRLSPKKARKPIPDEIAYAIAEAFHRAETPRDQIITSILALLTCAPARLSEVLKLPADAEVVEAPGEGLSVPDAPFSEDIRFHYGLRWFPVKGGRPAIKFVPREMVPVAIEAMRRLRLHTVSARQLAAWMMANPGQMPLPEDLEHVRVTKTLTHKELKELYGNVAISRGAERGYQRVGRNQYSFESIEAHWKDQLPLDWPIVDPATGLRYDEALCVVHPFTFKPAASPERSRVEMISDRTIHLDLASRRGSGIFARLGVVLPNGTSPKFTTHQIRHYLNTIAQRANVPQAHIAMWSGRRNVMQNAAYDHTDRDALVDDIIGRTDTCGSSLPVIVDDADEAVKTSFLKQNITSTPIGFCLADLRFSPCDKAGACLDCARLVCIAEPGQRRDALARDVERRRHSLANFVEAEARGRLVNPRARAAVEAAVSHGERLLAAVDDPARVGTLIPNTSIGKLTGFSHDRRLSDTASARRKINSGQE